MTLSTSGTSRGRIAGYGIAPTSAFRSFGDRVGQQGNRAIPRTPINIQISIKKTPGNATFPMEIAILVVYQISRRYLRNIYYILALSQRTFAKSYLMVKHATVSMCSLTPNHLPKASTGDHQHTPTIYLFFFAPFSQVQPPRLSMNRDR